MSFDDDDSDLEKREYPDESDLERDSELSFVPCPKCRKQIAEDSQRCHYCGEYVTIEPSAGRMPLWMIIALALLALSFAFWMLVSGHWL